MLHQEKKTKRFPQGVKTEQDFSFAHLMETSRTISSNVTIIAHSSLTEYSNGGSLFIWIMEPHKGGVDQRGTNRFACLRLGLSETSKRHRHPPWSLCIQFLKLSLQSERRCGLCISNSKLGDRPSSRYRLRLARYRVGGTRWMPLHTTTKHDMHQRLYCRKRAALLMRASALTCCGASGLRNYRHHPSRKHTDGCFMLNDKP